MKLDKLKKYMHGNFVLNDKKISALNKLDKIKQKIIEQLGGASSVNNSNPESFELEPNEKKTINTNAKENLTTFKKNTFSDIFNEQIKDFLDDNHMTKLLLTIKKAAENQGVILDLKKFQELLHADADMITAFRKFNDKYLIKAEALVIALFTTSTTSLLFCLLDSSTIFFFF